MRYFRLLPEVQINENSFRNIFQKMFLESVNEDDLINYRVGQHERIELVAHKFYRTVEYWWVIAIINNFNDMVFDMPLEEDIIQTIAREKSTTNGNLDLLEFARQYDALEAENDLKRTIKLVKPNKLPVVIKEVLRVMNTS